MIVVTAPTVIFMIFTGFGMVVMIMIVVCMVMAIVVVVMIVVCVVMAIVIRPVGDIVRARWRRSPVVYFSGLRSIPGGGFGQSFLGIDDGGRHHGKRQCRRKGDCQRPVPQVHDQLQSSRQ